MLPRIGSFPEEIRIKETRVKVHVALLDVSDRFAHMAGVHGKKCVLDALTSYTVAAVYR